MNENGRYLIVGHVNPVATYPAFVIPVVSRGEEYCAVYLSDEYILDFRPVTEFIKNRPNNLSECSGYLCTRKQSRLFAINQTNVVLYDVSEAAKFWQKVVDEYHLLESNPFVALDVAIDTRKKSCITATFAACVKMLVASGADEKYVRSWYDAQIAEIRREWGDTVYFSTEWDNLHIEKLTLNKSERIVPISEADGQTISAWNECLRTAIFGDLIRLRELNRDVFSELFYGRTNAINEFSHAAKPIVKSGSNLIIIGDAGIGKSTFLFRIFMNEKNELEKIIYPIFIDLKHGSIGIDSLLINLIDKLNNYFVAINRPIDTLEKPREIETIPYNLLKISEHLSRISYDNVSKRALIFVDDLDYADDLWQEFLLKIHNLIVSPKLSFVLSLRPLLEFKIRTSSDTAYRDFIRGSRRIELSPLSITKVLFKRLAPIIKENAENPFHLYIKRLFHRDSAICKILREYYGITDLEQLARFQFPFSNELLSFMTQITNGNLREVFDIAESILRYIFMNSDELESFAEEGQTKYLLPADTLMDLFHTNRSAYESNYEFINLNEIRSADGNSLYFNVLEAVKYFGVIDNKVMKLLSLLGHQKHDVSRSLQVLENRIHRLITPSRAKEKMGSVLAL